MIVSIVVPFLLGCLNNYSILNMSSVKFKKETTMGSKERPDQVDFITPKFLKEPKRLETLNPNPRARPAG